MAYGTFIPLPYRVPNLIALKCQCVHTFLAEACEQTESIWTTTDDCHVKLAIWLRNATAHIGCQMGEAEGWQHERVVTCSRI